jgi:hypothetical protein
MIKAGSLDMAAWEPLSGFVDVECSNGTISGRDVNAKATLSAFAVRNVDGTTVVGGTDIPGDAFTPAGTRWPLSTTDTSVSAVAGGSSSIATDYLDAQECPNDGEGHYGSRVVGAIAIGNEKFYTGGCCMRVIATPRRQTQTTIDARQIILGVQSTIGRTVLFDGTGSESVVVTGYTLNTGDVGSAGTELPTTSVPQTAITCPAEKQYRSLPLDIQRRVAVSVPRFYITAGALTQRHNGIFSDVMGFVGRLVASNRGRKDPVMTYFDGEDGSWRLIPGTRAGVLAYPPDVSRRPIVRGVNATNVANFPMFPASMYAALSADDIPPGRRFLSVGGRISAVCCDQVISSSLAITSIDHFTLGQLQCAITRGNPGDDPQNAWGLAVAVASAQDSTAERNDRPGISRTDPNVSSLLHFDVSWTDDKSADRIFTVPGNIISASVRRLVVSLAATVPFPESLPATAEQVSDPLRWPKVQDGERVYVILAFSAQSGVQVFTNPSSTDNVDLVYMPGCPELLVQRNDAGQINAVRSTGREGAWMTIECFNLDMALGLRAGSE